MIFSDGVTVGTKGTLRTLELYDGWYVVGEGMLIPVKDLDEANEFIKRFYKHKIKENP